MYVYSSGVTAQGYLKQVRIIWERGSSRLSLASFSPVAVCKKRFIPSSQMFVVGEDSADRKVLLCRRRKGELTVPSRNVYI